MSPPPPPPPLLLLLQNKAMGDVWGYQESYYSWISGVTDNALYPGLIWSMIQPLLNITVESENGTTTSFFPPDAADSEIFEGGLLTPGGMWKVGCKVPSAVCFGKYIRTLFCGRAWQ